MFAQGGSSRKVFGSQIGESKFKFAGESTDPIGSVVVQQDVLRPPPAALMPVSFSSGALTLCPTDNLLMKNPCTGSTCPMLMRY